MKVSLWVWLATIAATIALLAFDFYAHVRSPHEPSTREAAAWSFFYVALAVVFGLVMMWLWDIRHASEFFAGYITEKSLSVDNLFVFVILMAKFRVPQRYQQKVLLVGVIIALGLRTILILLGAEAIEHFSWIFYIFGLFLLFTALKLVFEKQEQDYKPNWLVRAAEKVLPATEEYHGARLTVVVAGKRCITPMLMVMIAIGMTDILFALDSIPAIFGLTNVAYIVFTANALALLGLIQLYFLLRGLLERLTYLSVGLALILALIGVKLMLEALRSNSLPFINAGEPLHRVPDIPTWLSLTVIVGTLILTTTASLISDARRKNRQA